MSSKTKTLMVSAGEASSDMHAAHVLEALRELGTDFQSFGMGAGKLEAQDMSLTVDCRELSVIGIVDVLKNYHRFVKRLKQLQQAMRERKPDLLIIVDYPDFNLKLAETAKSLGIPVLFYISPQVWAWRSKRIKRIGERIDHMAVLFPFEVKVYEQAGIPVTYVGHPLVDDAVSTLSPSDARKTLGLPDKSTLVALLPGSRTGELNRNLPTMLDTALLLASSHPKMEFVIPVAPTLDKTLVEQHLEPYKINIHLITENAYDVMRASDAVLASSGTATLETAMIGTPMAVMYRVNAINYAIMKRMIEIDDIGLVNIVAGKRICQEFVQHDAVPSAIAEEMERCLFNAEYRSAMQKEFETVQQRMGTGGASTRVAELVNGMLAT